MTDLHVWAQVGDAAFGLMFLAALIVSLAAGLLYWVREAVRAVRRAVARRRFSREALVAAQDRLAERRRSRDEYGLGQSAPLDWSDLTVADVIGGRQLPPPVRRLERRPGHPGPGR